MSMGQVGPTRRAPERMQTNLANRHPRNGWSMPLIVENSEILYFIRVYIKAIIEEMQKFPCWQR